MILIKYYIDVPTEEMFVLNYVVSLGSSSAMNVKLFFKVTVSKSN